MEALKIIIPIYFIIFVLGGFRNIKMYLLLTGIVTMPFRTTYTIVDVGPYVGWTNGINIALSDVSFILLFIYLFITKTKFEGFSRRLTFAAMLFIGSVLLSLINSTWLRLSFFEAILIAQVFFLYYIVLTAAIQTEKELRMVMVMLMISLIVQGTFGTVQYLTGKELDIFSTGKPPVEESGEDFLSRALGTIGKPNALAMYVVPLILLVTALLMKSRGLYRRLGTLAISAGGLALILSLSRGGWVAFAAAFIVLLFILAKGGYVRAKAPFLALLVAALVVVMFFGLIEARLMSQEGADATQDRINLIKIAWNMIKDYPVLGVGANTFMSVVHRYTRGPELQDIYLHMVHNQYLLVFAETGLVGLIAFLWFMLACFRESRECVRKQSELSQMVGVSVGAGFIAMAAHMMVDMYSSPLCLSLIFVFCGLCSAAKKVGVAAGTAPPVRKIGRPPHMTV
jgi:O-antigen ligase